MAYFVPSMKIRTIAITGSLVVLSALAGCSDDPAEQAPDAGLTPGQTADPLTAEDSAPDPSAWQEDTLALCETSLADFDQSVQALDDAARAIPESTQAEVLADARQAWRDALGAWGAASLCLHGPLPGADAQSHGERLAMTAAAPAMAGFIDAIPGYSDSGIVHDDSLNLTPDNLRRQHQVTDDAEVALGLYALEVVLFGEPERRSDDFTRPTEGSKQPTARRSKLLKLQLDDLVEQSRQWQQVWAEHRPTFSSPQFISLLTVWSLSLDDLSILAQRLSEGQTGYAQITAHDQLLVTAQLSSLETWWSSEPTLEQVRHWGLDYQQWADLADPLSEAAAGNASWLDISRTAESASRLLGTLHTQAGHQL